MSKSVKALDKEIETLHSRIVELRRERNRLVNREVANFRLRCTYDVVLSEDEIWPDNDAPPNPSVNDVKEVMDSCGSPDVIIRDWSLEPEFGESCKITVTKLKSCRDD